MSHQEVQDGELERVTALPDSHLFATVAKWDYHPKNLLSRDRNSTEGWGSGAGAATGCFSMGILGKNNNEAINNFLPLFKS